MILNAFINQQRPFKAILRIAFCAFFCQNFYANAEVYLSTDEFVQIVAAPNDNQTQKFNKKTLWLNKTIQHNIKGILDHQYPKLRLTYFSNETNPISNSATIWILEEIGKERPITFGIAVKNNRVTLIRVLAFRESRGYEIKIPSFAKQFEEIGVDKQGKLDRPIDGITGATMSVNAMKKITRVAILLHNVVIEKLQLEKQK